MSVGSVDPQECRCIVSRIIASWSGYQLGVDFGSGGSDTLAKDEWFKDILTEYILTTKGLNAEDLEDWLNNVLYTEFNLILEDDSVYPTSLVLIEAFQYIKQDKPGDLDRLLRSLPSVDAVREVTRHATLMTFTDHS
uniref:Pre-rRNA-processing protein TSR2 homolog n=1 Tax=Angiostrongylus cantonensis TaxID=6313 RepID=A0A0K0D2C9_ANGCA